MNRPTNLVSIWLSILISITFAIIALGGLTRLTGSGLSITEWKPIAGALPPLSDEAWQAEFNKYQQIPQFQLVNKDMSLGEFKTIYWWEWTHRQLARLFGLVFAVGFGFLWFTRRLPRGSIGAFVGVGVFAGFQAAIGWWMVTSGLEGSVVRVAATRLAIHLGMGVILLGALVWLYARHRRYDDGATQSVPSPRMLRWSGWLLGVCFVQIILGALVAGNDAGKVYTDWPFMAGSFFPPDPFKHSPWWMNLLVNEGLVQFLHRVVGPALGVLVVIAWFRSPSGIDPRFQRALDAVAVGTILQLFLGIVTLVLKSPWGLAFPHQLLAIGIFWAMTLCLYYSRYGRAVAPVT